MTTLSIKDTTRNVSILFQYYPISNGFVKGIMTIKDPDLSLRHKREVRGITGRDTVQFVEIQALVTTHESKLLKMDSAYVYKHFLQYMKSIFEDTI